MWRLVAGEGEHVEAVGCFSIGLGRHQESKELFKTTVPSFNKAVY